MFLGKASETCTNVYFSSEQFFPDYNLRTLFSYKNKSLIRIPLSGKNRHKAQRNAKFYINKCRSASCMQGGLKQASA